MLVRIQPAPLGGQCHWGNDAHEAFALPAAHGAVEQWQFMVTFKLIPFLKWRRCSRMTAD